MVVESYTPSGQVFKEAQRRGPPDRHQSPTGRLDQQSAVCDVDLRPFRARPAGASVLTKPATDMTTDFLSRLQTVSVERRMGVPPCCVGSRYSSSRLRASWNAAFLSAARIRRSARLSMPKAMANTTYLSPASAASHISASRRGRSVHRQGVRQRRLLTTCQPPSVLAE